MNKKPVIKKIKFSKEEQVEIDRLKQGQSVPIVRTRTNKNGIKQDIVFNRRFAYEMGRKRLVELYGGRCTSCTEWPAYKIMYNVVDDQQGAWLVERYCQKCYDKREEYIKK